MLTRRSALLLGTAAIAVSFGGPAVLAQGADPTAFIQQIGSQFVSIVNAPGSAQQKRAQMQPIVESSVDIEGIGRFCLGRFWRTATPQQQQEYIRLFHGVLLTSISSRLADYRGIGFSVTGAQRREDGVLVGTVIRRPNQQPANVQWVVSQTGVPKILDVIIEGTSLRLTQRSDYASYISRNGNNIDALLNAMRQQAGA